MKFDIDKVIYSYLFICFMLLLYNIIYITTSKRGKKKQDRSIRAWKKEVKRQLHRLTEGESIEENHKAKLKKQLTNSNQLISYVRALDSLREKGIKLQKYLRENYVVIQALAYQYAKKDSMDKAFFAYFIFKNPPQDDKEYTPLMEILISFMNNSTVYCRENVLNALYALGNCQGVENAFQIINDNQWFHHRKLLSDGLMTFTGDKDELAERLWTYRKKWDDNLMVSVIQFITANLNNFDDRFLNLLKAEEVSLEIKLAIMRYFRRYYFEPAKAVIIAYLKKENNIDENLRIVAASVLETYPGEETIEVLKDALHDSNWYLRYNAASSLVNLNVDIRKIRDVLGGTDRYAKEILTYMISQHYLTSKRKAG